MSDVLECKPVRNRSGVIIKAYEGIPEILTFDLMLGLFFFVIFVLIRYPNNEFDIFAGGVSHGPLAFLYNQKEMIDDDIGTSFLFEGRGTLPESPKVPPTYFGWIKFVINLTDEEFLKVCGPDAVHYLSFQKHLMVVIIIVTAICLVVILPINYLMGSNYEEERFGRTTASNLATNSNWLWVHIAVVVLYVPLITFTMQDSSGNKAFESAAQVRTVFVKNIAPAHRSEEFIKEHFNTRFPNIHIENIQLTYRYDKYLKYHRKYEKVKSILEELEGRHPSNVKIRPTKCSRHKVNALNYYLDEEAKLLNILQDLRRTMRSNHTGMAFITVATPEDAKHMVKCYRSVNPTKWRLSIAPQTADIVWENLRLTTILWYLLWILVNSILFAVLCFLVTPAVVLDLLIQHNKSELKSVSLIQMIIGNLMLCLFSFLMPHIVLYSDDLLKYYTLSKNQFWVMVKIFFYLFVMVLLLPILGYISIQNFTENLVDGNPVQWQCTFRPTRSDFFLKYIIAEAFLLVSMDLLRLGDLVVYGWRVMTMKCKAELPYIKKTVFRLFPYGKNYAWTIFIFTIAIVHSVFCPLIMPFALVYILIKHFVDRHNIYFGFIPSNMVSYEGGKIHTVAINMTSCSIITLKLFMAMVFASVNDLMRAAVCFILLVIILIFFPVLMAFRKKPKIQIGASSMSPTYLPKPLQNDGRPTF